MRELQAYGLKVAASDLIDWGWPGVYLRSFYDIENAPGRGIVTKPPIAKSMPGMVKGDG